MSKVLEIVKNECPYCNEIIYVNKRTFANHVRWCNKNPRYEEIKQNTINKIKEYGKNKSTKKQHICECEICNKKYVVEITDNKFELGKYRKTCSDACSKILTANNTDQFKKGNNVRNSYIKSGKTIFKGTEKKCLECGKIFSAERKKDKFCSCECAHKNRHKENIKNLELKEIYRLQTTFKFSLKDYPEEFEFSLIKENGWYKAKNHGDNLKGISRDHMFSVSEGFEQGIDPYYISHPANCKLMKHEDNFKKNKNCSITKEELFQNVNEWNKKYGTYRNKIDYTSIEDFKEK